MSGYTGFVDNTAGKLIAHENFIDLIESKALLNGWTTLRKTNTGGTGDARAYELIMQGVGLSGTEQIFVGMRCYQSSTSDYYNIELGVFTGYVAGNAWSAQPGFINSAMCAHNQRIDYWININAQRWMGGTKVGTPVYESFYIGKFFPYATPSQYPYPVACIGTLNRNIAMRYSVVDGNQHRCGFFGFNNVTPGTVSTATQFNIRLNDGNWYYNTKYATPWVDGTPDLVRDTDNIYHLTPIQIVDYPNGGATVNSNVWGYLDGVQHVSGFNLSPESTTTDPNGKNWVLIQDINRNNIGGYVAMDMTP